MIRDSVLAIFLMLLSFPPCARAADPPTPTRDPMHRVVDLDIGESRQVELRDGSRARVKLLALEESRDPIRDAVRRAVVKVEVNGQAIELTSATYHLPRTVAGVQVDCPITRGYLTNTDQRPLGPGPRPPGCGSGRPARPGSSRGRSSIRSASAGSPARPRWPTSRPSSTASRVRPGARSTITAASIIGGAEGLVDVIAATAGLVVSAGTDRLPGYKDTPVDPRYDVVYVLDDRGWYYRYSHLQSIDPAIKPGATVAMGQKIGVLGKEGGSGGWSHLHFEIVGRQPSGRWGTQEGYAFLWEAALREQQPAVIAVARPHHLAWSASGSRSTVRGPGAARVPSHATTGPSPTGRPPPALASSESTTEPGEYSEILKVTDDRGEVGLRLRRSCRCSIRVEPEPLPPGIHAAFAPTQRHPPRRPDHVQGAHLRHHRRRRDLGLRRRHAAGPGPLGRQRREAGARRLRDRDPPLHPAGRLPAARRAHRPPRPQGDRAAVRARRACEVIDAEWYRGAGQRRQTRATSTARSP